METTAPLVALTFDDGPTDLGVDALLPVLDAHGAKATFFLLGKEVRARPKLARRIAASGHELANHSFNHPRMVGHLPGWYDGQILQTEAALHAVAPPSGLFRPPYGAKLVGLPLALNRQRLQMITWDIEDPYTTDPGAFARQVVAQARPGSIILVHPMHRANATARAALPLILEGLRAKGLRAVTVGELLAHEGR